MSGPGEVTLRETTQANLWDVLRLKVAPQQEAFVASNAVSLAEAHFEPELPRFRAVYAGDVPVGFLRLEYDREDDSYTLWRFMTDGRFSGARVRAAGVGTAFRARPNASRRGRALHEL